MVTSQSLGVWAAEQRRRDLHRRFTLATCGQAVVFVGEVCRLALETGQFPSLRLWGNQVRVVNRSDQGWWKAQLFSWGLDELAAKHGVSEPALRQSRRLDEITVTVPEDP